MTEIFNFFKNNYDWIFSGIGIFIASSLIYLFKRKRRKTEGHSTLSIGEIKPGISNIINSETVTQINNYNQKEDANLKLVDVTLSDNDFGVFYLDIKLRNIGDKVAFLKKVALHIIDKGELKDPVEVQYQLFQISGDYTFELDINSDEKIIHKSISHKIKPDDVEFIRITIRNAEIDPSFTSLYHISMDLLYNEDDKTIKIPSLLIGLNSSKAWEFNNGDLDGDERIIKKNKNIAKRFRNIEGIKNPHFEQILSDN